MDIENKLIQNLPFPIFRIIIDYIRILPVISNVNKKMMENHFINKYCKRGGQYISSNHRKKSFHLSCRNYSYVSDIKNTKYYHIEYINFSQLILNKNKDNECYPCPVIFYSKQIHNYYKIKWEKKNIFQFAKNKEILNIHSNENYSIIPEMFHDQYQLKILSSKDEDSIKNLRRIYGIAQYLFKHELINKFQKSTKYQLCEWLYILNYQNMHIMQDSLIKNIHNFISSPYVEYYISYSIGIERILKKNELWGQYLIYKYPHLLDTISEPFLIEYFNDHKSWFLTYIHECKESLNYITLY
jgi:hypothetical protein